MKERRSDKETKKWRATGSFEPKAASVRVSIYLVLVVVLVSQNKSFLKILFVASSSIIGYIQSALKQSPPQIQKAMSKPVTSTPRSTYFIIQAFSAFRTSASRDDANLDRSCTSDPIAAWQT